MKYLKWAFLAVIVSVFAYGCEINSIDGGYNFSYKALIHHSSSPEGEE